MKRKIIIVSTALILFTSYILYALSAPTCDTYHFIVNLDDGYEDTGVLFLPSNYNDAGDPVRLIISCHGSGTVIDDDFELSDKEWNYYLVEMGYAILDVNGGIESGRHYGSAEAIESYEKAYEYVVDNYNLKSEVFLLGGSMGGLSSLNLAVNTDIPVIAIAEMCPVVDLKNQAWCYPWYGGDDSEKWSIQRKAIAEIYSFDGINLFGGWSDNKEASDEEMKYFEKNICKVQKYDPILNYQYFADNKLPIKVWQADTDPTVNSVYGKEFVHLIQTAGGIAEHQSYDIGGHTPPWDSQTVISITKELKLDRTNKTFYDIYKWFKRWE